MIGAGTNTAQEFAYRQVIQTSRNLGDHLNFSRDNVTAHYDYRGAGPAPGGTSFFILTQVQSFGATK